MRRGTTPTHTFNLDGTFDTDKITLLNLAYSQEGNIILEKSLKDCVIEPQKIIVNLTEDDTLLFKNKDALIEIQMRIGIGEERYASNIFRVKVEKLLKDGDLNGN